MNLSIRRAKALRPFVPCEDLDAIARLHELRKRAYLLRSSNGRDGGTLS